MSAPSPVDRLSRQLGDRLSWLFLISAGLTCFEVLMDWAFRAPTIWVHDTTIMMSATCFLLGGAYALQRGEHIRITFLYDLMPRRLQRACDLAGFAIALVYLLALGWFVGGQAIESVRLVERSGRAWDFPMPMVIRVAFLLGVLLLILQAASILIAMLRGGTRAWERDSTRAGGQGPT